MALGRPSSPILHALSEVSTQTPVDIHVLLTRKYFDFSPLKRCRSWYFKLHIGNPASAGGILLYLNTRSHKAAIYGGPEVHFKMGQGFWNQEIRLLQKHLKTTHYENAIALTLTHIAHELKKNLK